MEEYTVSRLSALIKRSVEENFNNITLKAEISALKTHSSGHLYFALKDAESVIDAVCWKWVASRQKIKLEDGMEVRCRGNVTTFPMRSKYQFVVEEVELAGVGEILKLLEARKQKLLAEGLFDSSKKKAIPYIPRLIGVITSPTGAVIRDMIHRIRARFPRNMLLWPVLVQGDGACKEISDAIYGINKLQGEMRPDVLIVARGGGSFEDLMPFNEEMVVRAVSDSEIPVISAVGHETDTTLIDYVSDLRAPTPTAAAELAVPEKIELQANLNHKFSMLNSLIKNYISSKKMFLTSNKMLDVNKVFEEKSQKLDFMFEKISGILNRNIYNCNSKLNKLKIEKPKIKENINEISERLNYLIQKKFEACKCNLQIFETSLEANSYLKILRKGFVRAQTLKNKAITSAHSANLQNSMKLIFYDGEVIVKNVPFQPSLFSDEDKKVINS